MIDVINLRKSFGDKEILKGINVTINKGDIVAVLGPSGSGKSTFLRCLNCMEDPTGGNIIFNGVDIAEELGFKKSSVSVAMKNLREKEQIRVTPEGYIYLTDSGRAIAEMIYERHQLLSRGLMSLGVDEQTATEDACRIEHVISQESFEAIKRHLHMTAEK